MHSALPKSQGDLSPNSSCSSKFPIMLSQRQRKLSKLALIFITIFGLLFWVWYKPPNIDNLQSIFGKKVYYKGGVRANADTISVSTTPYIYPDLKDLEMYRQGKYIKISNDKTVESSRHGVIYSGSNAPPKIVMVVGLDDNFSQDYLENVLQDRLDYAQKNGFGLYARYLRDFETTVVDNDGSKISTEFAKVLMMREAMYAFEGSKWMWWLDQDAVITNHDYDLVNELLTPENLNKKMNRDAPILPPESIIHTYKRVPASHIKLIVSQNDRGISTSSFLLMNDQLYGKVLMGYWSDPLHRSYNGFQGFGGFQGHVEASLTHMVQWHPAILSKMAVVPHKYLGSRPDDGQVLKGQKWNDGDFVYLVRDGNEVDHPGYDQITNDWKKIKKQSVKS